LAAAYGVLNDYYGVEGLTKSRPDALLAVLGLLGAPVAKPEDVEPALRARRNERGQRLLPEVIVAWDDRSTSIPLRSKAAKGRGELTLAFEDGSMSERFVELDERWLEVGERLPHGYHRISLRAGGVEAESALLSAPGHSFRAAGEGTPRWGLFAPLYATRSGESLSAGDFSDLGRLVETTARHGGGFVATLPLLSSFVEDPSPYSPVSRLFWNELYLDPRRTPEWEEGVLDVRAFARNDFVDYDALVAWKRPLLESLSRRARSRRPQELLDFTRARPDVLEYARFRARVEDGRRRDDATGNEDFEAGPVLYHVYAQMAAEEQLQAVSERALASDVRLYFDLPLGVHRSGFDAFSRKHLFAHEADVGAPPDAVFPDGQNWGFPPLLPDKIREDGYLYLRQTLATAMRHADLLRVDHVMGLNRQFWIPRGFEKRDGVYVRYPADELYAVFNLESHRNQCELVGENLGIVPESVNERLGRHRWRGIYVLQFSLTGVPEQPVAPIPKDVVASFNTHDTPTFSGFCQSRDVAERVEAGLLEPGAGDRIRGARAEAIAALDRFLGGTPEELSDRLDRWLSFLLASEAELVAVALEDFWLEAAPQNVPGRVDLPNWRRMHRHSLDALPDDVVAKLAAMTRWRSGFRRERV
jgi:4-alpha-glucanotransferase